MTLLYLHSTTLFIFPFILWLIPDFFYLNHNRTVSWCLGQNLIMKYFEKSSYCFALISFRMHNVCVRCNPSLPNKLFIIDTPSTSLMSSRLVKENVSSSLNCLSSMYLTLVGLLTLSAPHVTIVSLSPLVEKRPHRNFSVPKV